MDALIEHGKDITARAYANISGIPGPGPRVEQSAAAYANMRKVAICLDYSRSPKQWLNALPHQSDAVLLFYKEDLGKIMRLREDLRKYGVDLPLSRFKREFRYPDPNPENGDIIFSISPHRPPSETNGVTIHTEYGDEYFAKIYHGGRESLKLFGVDLTQTIRLR